jgi:Domain of unknown function (DUF397)
MLTTEWRKSTYSNGQSSCVEVAGAWHKSSHSNGQSNCVEVRAGQPHAVALRDSKDRGGPELGFTAGAWAAFVRGVKQGEFDLA